MIVVLNEEVFILSLNINPTPKVLSKNRIILYLLNTFQFISFE